MMSLSHVPDFFRDEEKRPKGLEITPITPIHSNTGVFVPLPCFPFSKYIFALNQMFYGDNSSPSQLA